MRIPLQKKNSARHCETVTNHLKRRGASAVMKVTLIVSWINVLVGVWPMYLYLMLGQ